MKYYLTMVFLLLNMANAFGEEPMQCDIGPVDKHFGATKWFVNSCVDNSTLVIYSYPESPASPFYFIFYIQDGSYQLYGEGTGNKEYTKAASEQLSKFTINDIKSLITETLSVKSHKNEQSKAPNKTLPPPQKIGSDEL